MRAIAILVIVVGAAWLFFAAGNNNTRSTRAPLPAVGNGKTVIPADIRDEVAAMNSVRLESVQWTKGGFGHVAILSFVIDNVGTAPVSDVTIDCRFYGQSGTRLGTTSETIFQTFPPKRKIKVSDVHLGFINDQSTGMNCEISGLKLR